MNSNDHLFPTDPWFGQNVLTQSSPAGVQAILSYLTTAVFPVSAGASSNNLAGITFSNSNGVSFGLSGSVITASAAGGGGAGAAISGGANSQGTGTVNFSNSNGVSFGLSNNGVMTASVQTNYQSTGNYLTTAMQSNAATLSNINFSAGTTSNNLSAITFSNSNGVSFGLSGSVVTATVATNYQAPGAYLTTAMQSNATTISNINISGGASSANVSAITFSNANGVTFGYDKTNITASVQTNYLTTGALSSQTLAISLSGNTATTNSSQISNGGYALAGGNNVTLQQSNNTISISVGNYITTAALSQNTSNYAGINAGMTGGSITVNTAGVSINLPAYLTTADLSQNSSQYFRNWKLTGNNAGTTSSQQGTDFWLAGGNGVTISGSSNSISFSVATNYQSQAAYLTTAALSQNTSNYAGINSAITGGSMTVNTSGISINLPAYLTTAALSQNTSNYAGTGFTSTSTGGTQITVTNNTSGLSMGIPLFITGVGMAAGASNLTLSAMTFANSNGISFGFSLGNNLTASYQEVPMSRFVPNDFIGGSATSSGGIGTLHVFPIDLQWPVTFGQINMIVSASHVTTTVPNTMSYSVQTGSSLGFTYQFSHTNSRFFDIFLFKRGTGGFSTEMETIGSTRNSIVSFGSGTYQFSGTAGAGGLTNSGTILSSYSMIVSLPGMTTGTMTSVNAASTITTYGQGYTQITGSTTASQSSSALTAAASSFSVAGAYPGTTGFASNKMIPFAFASSLSAGEYWIGIIQSSSSSSASGSTGGNLAAGNTFSTTVNASVITVGASVVMTSVGMTSSIASSLGWIGFASTSTMAPVYGQGSLTATYSPNSTYMNNAGNPNGAIGFTQVATNVSFWRPWMEFASNRI